MSLLLIGTRLRISSLLAQTWEQSMSFRRKARYCCAWNAEPGSTRLGAWFKHPPTLARSDIVVVGQFGSSRFSHLIDSQGWFGRTHSQNSNVISHPGLWAIAFGAGNTNSGAPNQLFFNVGTSEGAGGLFGFFAPVATDLTQGNDQ